MTIWLDNEAEYAAFLDPTDDFGPLRIQCGRVGSEEGYSVGEHGAVLIIGTDMYFSEIEANVDHLPSGTMPEMAGDAVELDAPLPVDYPDPAECSWASTDDGRRGWLQMVPEPKRARIVALPGGTIFIALTEDDRLEGIYAAEITNDPGGTLMMAWLAERTGEVE